MRGFDIEDFLDGRVIVVSPMFWLDVQNARNFFPASRLGAPAGMTTSQPLTLVTPRLPSAPPERARI